MVRESPRQRLYYHWQSDLWTLATSSSNCSEDVVIAKPLQHPESYSWWCLSYRTDWMACYSLHVCKNTTRVSHPGVFPRLVALPLHNCATALKDSWKFSSLQIRWVFSLTKSVWPWAEVSSTTGWETSMWTERSEECTHTGSLSSLGMWGGLVLLQLLSTCSGKWRWLLLTVPFTSSQKKEILESEVQEVYKARVVNKVMYVQGNIPKPPIGVRELWLAPRAHGGTDPVT